MYIQKWITFKVNNKLYSYFCGFLLILPTHSIALCKVDKDRADKSVTIGARITEVNKLLATGIFILFKMYIEQNMISWLVTYKQLLSLIWLITLVYSETWTLIKK